MAVELLTMAKQGSSALASTPHIDDMWNIRDIQLGVGHGLNGQIVVGHTAQVDILNNGQVIFGSGSQVKVTGMAGLTQTYYNVADENGTPLTMNSG